MQAARHLRVARSFTHSQRFAPTAVSTTRTMASMPTKRKRNGPREPNPRPPNARRSRRTTADQASKASDPALSCHPYQPEHNTTSECDKLCSEEAVAQARHRLTEMEEKLLAVTKMQQLAVQSSDPQILDTMVHSTVASGNSLENEKDCEASSDNGNYILSSQAPSSGQNHEEQSQNGADASSVDRGAHRRPPVNSENLPLPWSGRLGYACLNTYLRSANPPVFSSRTCRINSILEHRHPLRDPTQPEHQTKNRPDKNKPASVERGRKYVQDIGLANVRDIIKMIRWNDKYGIKFMRLSSEMFPFASHGEHGYSLEYASEELKEAGREASKLGHRLTTHPGQYTQLGSPRKEVIEASVRDLEYHAQMLSLLRLSDQLDRDAVMILHMGGVYGDKGATLERFRSNYETLSAGVKKRLVLENDDVSWSVHDLLPICEELNVPLVLDYHHHNIVFDPSVREGTQDIIQLYPRIKATWDRKGITQKMHYSEPTAAAVTPRERRKHSARVKTLPPCACDMDLMIEAKDKEQAVFELMRTFKLPGWDLYNDMIPHERGDESKHAAIKKERKTQKVDGKSKVVDDILIESMERVVAQEDEGMGGPESRVFWPEGMEEWLRPKKKEPKASKVEE